MNAKGETLYILNYPPVSGVRFFTLKHNPFIHPTVMIKRDVALSAGLYQNGFKHVEDYEFWTRIVYKYKTGNLNEVLLRYRIHGQQITNKHRKAMLIRGLKVRFLAMFRWLSNLQAKDR
jgi:hypothetical protein